MKENREGESPEYSRTAAGRGRFTFAVPHRGPVITRIPRSPTAKINLSSDPAQPHPLASLRAAPGLADAAGRRTRGRSAVLHHQTALPQHNNTRKKTNTVLFGGEAAIPPRFVTRIAC